MRPRRGHNERAPNAGAACVHRAQRGFAALTLAFIALFGTVILAGPMLGRSSLGLRSPEAYSPLAVSDTTSAARNSSSWSGSGGRSTVALFSSSSMNRLRSIIALTIFHHSF